MRPYAPGRSPLRPRTDTDAVRNLPADPGEATNWAIHLIGFPGRRAALAHQQARPPLVEAMQQGCP
jgi:hypothetical protein